MRRRLEEAGPDDEAAAIAAALAAFEEARRARPEAVPMLSPWAAAGRREQMRARQPRPGGNA
jgi:hypothetical protein